MYLYYKPQIEVVITWDYYRIFLWYNTYNRGLYSKKKCLYILKIKRYFNK